MQKLLSYELRRFAGIVIVLALVGLVFGQVMMFLFLALAGYSGWHLRNIWLLDRWLREGKRFRPPESRGTWGDIFYQIHRLQQRNRKQKKRLSTMLTQFRKVTAAMPYAIVVISPNDEIEWWNDAATELLTLRYPDGAGQRIGNLITDPAFISYLEGQDYSEPLDMVSPYEHNAILAIQVIPYGKNQRLLIARDVTEFRRVERMRRDFVANVSHELRTPLTVLMGYLETMGDELAGQTESRPSQVVAMREQADRMYSIITDLLALARLESQGRVEDGEPVCVPAILQAVHQDAIRLSGDEHHKIMLAADNGLWINGNREELRSLFSNLLFNAVRYTAAEGKIGIRWYEDDSGAHFEISDTGIGIPAQYISRLTERFYRVDVSRSRQRGGTGLGLAIVKHVLLRHDSTLYIQSEPGQGSTFRCDFPRSRVIRAQIKAKA